MFAGGTNKRRSNNFLNFFKGSTQGFMGDTFWFFNVWKFSNVLNFYLFLNYVIRLLLLLFNTYRYSTEISNVYSKWWVDSIYTYNFWFLYSFILNLILYSHCSYSMFEVVIILILNSTHDVVDSAWIDIYKNHKICVICILTLQYK